MSRSVPFKITDINHGLQEAKGLIKTNEEGLELEFEVKDTLVGAFKSGVKTVNVPYGNLKSVILKKGMINSKIILEGISMTAFDELPGVDIATCKLKVKRKDRKEAEQFVSEARLELSEYRLKEMEE